MQFTKESEKKLRFALSIVTSLLLAVSGVLFVLSCYAIYKSGSSPFTRESIADSFSRIAVPVWITVGAVIAGGVFYLIFPPEEKKLKGKRTDLLVLDKLRLQRVLCDDDIVLTNVKKEEKKRFYLTVINVILVTLGATLPLVYLLNPANFPAISGEYNSEIARGMTVYILALVPVFVYEIVYIILFDISVKKEIEVYKSLPKGDAFELAVKEEELTDVFKKIASLFEKNSKDITLGVRIALLLCGISFVVIGIFNGGMADVLQKAIKICTECIGLG